MTPRLSLIFHNAAYILTPLWPQPSSSILIQRELPWVLFNDKIIMIGVSDNSCSSLYLVGLHLICSQVLSKCLFQLNTLRSIVLILSFFWFLQQRAVHLLHRFALPRCSPVAVGSASRRAKCATSPRIAPTERTKPAAVRTLLPSNLFKWSTSYLYVWVRAGFGYTVYLSASVMDWIFSKVLSRVLSFFWYCYIWFASNQWAYPDF